LLFGRGQYTLQADNQEIPDQVGVNFLGSAAHVLLLKAIHSFADGSFDLSWCFHCDLKRQSSWKRARHQTDAAPSTSRTLRAKTSGVDENDVTGLLP
jgi:hypothetical protein